MSVLVTRAMGLRVPGRRGLGAWGGGRETLRVGGEATIAQSILHANSAKLWSLLRAAYTKRT